VEYVSHDREAGIVDRAAASGMNFKVPKFAECRAEPATVSPGGATTVTASGLLPNREVHLLIGDTTVANGATDAMGSTTIRMPIPPDARLGQRLVTVGALAVSADCSVTVVPRPSCFGRPATVIGTAGNDVLRGTPGDDVIAGLEGNDVINGLGGNDLICGGDGNDVLTSGAGNDRLDGGAGNDVLNAGTGSDILLGGPGNDVLNAGSGNDTLDGGEGNDACNGGLGVDTATGCEAKSNVP
jgi:Ca2+-binding RTX toxin-like protein